MYVPSRLLSTLTPICDSETSRYALGAVCLERVGDTAHAIATDGRRLVAVEWPDTDTPETERVDNYAALIPASACKAVDKAGGLPTRRNPQLGRVSIDETSTNGTFTATVYGKGGTSTVTAETEPGRFPRWREVVDYRRSFADSLSARFTRHSRKAVEAARTDYVCVTLDPRYLAEVCTALAKIGTSDDSRGVECFIPVDGESAVLLKTTAADLPKATGVIMPLGRDK